MKCCRASVIEGSASESALEGSFCERFPPPKWIFYTQSRSVQRTRGFRLCLLVAMLLNIWDHFLPLPATTFQKRNTRWSSQKSTSYFFQPALLICIGTGDTFIHTCHGWHETVGKGETRCCACQRQVILIYAICCDCCEFDLRNLFWVWLSKDRLS